MVVTFGLIRTLTTPDHLYAVSGEFAGCPSRPSCVSSRAGSADHKIAPLRYSGQMSVVVSRLERLVSAMDGVSEVRREGNYIHAVFQTPTMKYRDDLELLVGAEGEVDVRSISRFGYRDFGVNRARVEALREAYSGS